MLTRIFSVLNCIALSILLSSSAYAATFLESGGKVVIEAESSGATGQWSRENKVQEAKGGSYLVWNGPDLFSGKNAGRDTLRYTFRVQKAGNYEMRWRSYITHNNTATEANDSWVRFPTGKNVAGQHALNGWTKAFQNQAKQWSWSAKTVDGVGKSIRQFFSKGDHVIEISGRSNGHAIDRIVMFRYGEIKYSQNSFEGFNVSSTVGGSQPPDSSELKPTTPQPVEPQPVEPQPVEPQPVEPQPVEPQPVEPQPVEPQPVEPQPVEPEPVVDMPVQTSAPVVSVDGNTLIWSAVQARSINIHGEAGTWLETIPGDSTQWTATAKGNYFVVATNRLDWSNWGRSNTVEVSGNGSTDKPSTDTKSGSVITTLKSAVYSRTSAEVFWTINSANAENVQFEVQRNGQVVFKGAAASYYDNQLAQATDYAYQLTALVGNKVIDQRTVSLTTNGDSPNSKPPTTTSNTEELNLRGSVYSRTAMELSWDRSTDADEASYIYNVYQDGQLVASANATSYFSDGFSAGQTYLFSLRVLDASGVEGRQHNVELTSFSGDKNLILVSRSIDCDSCSKFNLQMQQPNGDVVLASDLFEDAKWHGQSAADIAASQMHIERSASGKSITISAKTYNAINDVSPTKLDSGFAGGVTVVEIDSQTGARLSTRFIDNTDLTK